MKIICSVQLALLLSAAAIAQASIRQGLQVNGVALGATYTAAVKKLGKPARDVTNRQIDQCIGSRIRTLYYPGLKLELVEGEKKIFTVFSFDVTSGTWNVSGINLGDASSVVEKQFGKTGRTIEKEKAGPRWSYDMTDESPGGTNFYFKNGKVVEISSTYEMC